MTTTNSFENAIRVDRKARTIEVTKGFDKASRRFGTAAYEAMQKVLQDNPGFRVVVKAPKVKADLFKGLTYDFMEKYITSHDGADSDRMKAFMDLRAESDEALAFGAEALSYSEIKAWFLKSYPEFAAFQQRREAALAA